MLRRSSIALAGVLIVAVCAAAASGVVRSGPEAVTAGERTYAGFTGAKKYRPGRLAFGAHELIIDVTWSKWREKVARGRGTYLVNDCMPYCAAGTITPTPTAVVLTGRIACAKRNVFRLMKVYFDGRRRTSRGFC